MAIQSQLRRSDIYVGDGVQTKFSFAFKLLKSDDAEVHVAPLDGIDAVLDPNAYVCVLNDDQDVNPGGTVTLKEPLAKGASLVIISGAAYVQPTVFTNRGAFFPKVLNDSLDRETILIQQLVEQVSRALITDPTDTITPRQLRDKMFAAVDEAIAAALEAKLTLEDAKRVLIEILDKKFGILAEIRAEGDKQDARVIAEGDTQIERIRIEADTGFVSKGTGGAEQTWKLAEDVPAGTIIALPNGLRYLVGRHHLRVAWNGIALALGKTFEEVGETDAVSTEIRLAFGASAGDEINAWVSPLGAADASAAVEAAQAAQEAVAELSRKVVYKNKESAA